MHVPSGRRTRIGAVATDWLEQGPGIMMKCPVQPVSAIKSLEVEEGGEGTADLKLTWFIKDLSFGAAVPPAHVLV